MASLTGDDKRKSSNYQKFEQQRNRYIDLKINGRLFPTWVLANFRKFHLPELIRVPGEDSCNVREGSKIEKLELRKYQVFLSSYLDYRSPYKDILVYHGLGAGKTGSTINVYNVLYNYTPGWNVFLLLKASLKGNWMGEIKKWLKKDDYEYRFRNIIFIHYDSPFADRNFADAKKTVDSSKKSLYIIEEVHNFIRNVYSNISSTSGKRAQSIYDAIIQDKRENPDTRVILLSGTPVINYPFELSLLFNLLRPGIFPRSEVEFNHLFVSGTGEFNTMNKNNRNLFQRRILGLVSYYYGSTPDFFATKTIHYVDVPMSEHQTDVYSIYEEIEEKLASKSKGGRGGSQTYKSYTRQASNFVFPQISQYVTGETRPRPGKFKVSERDALKLSEGRDDDVMKKNNETGSIIHISQYLAAINTFIKELIKYFDTINNTDASKGYTIMDDVKKFKENYKGVFIDFHNNEKHKSKLYIALTNCSTKMVNIIFNIMMSKGPVIVYSNYVLMEGLQIFKIYLKYFNFYNWMEKKTVIPGKLGYTEFHGQIKSWDDRYAGMAIYNDKTNKFGEVIKIMLISPAGAEGLSLSNTRQVHIMEPYWNEVRITQMIGRAIRFCSHKDLEIEERHVDVYRYKSVRKNNSLKLTTDQQIEDGSRNKEGLLQSFLSCMKEAAVDCVLYRNHNNLTEDYSCFQFDENRLFDKQIGPAYKDNIYDDMKLDNGLNSANSTIVKIKVMKIKAVILKSKPEEDPVYSEPEYYWYYDKSHVVYDYDLHFAVGKVALDQNIPVKIDKETYVIDYVIPIPLIND